MTLFHIGIDLAWADKSGKKTNETGIVMLDPAGNVVEAAWTLGVHETVAWLDSHVPANALLFVDAPLVVNNPCTTIVGTFELGYEIERPRYKRKPRRMSTAEFRPLRSAECDELIRRVALLKDADPPMNLMTHTETTRLVEEKSPTFQKEYKHREDLLDAALCAWTASLWIRWGETRCQILGLGETTTDKLRATLIAPARPEQRRSSSLI